MENSRVISRQEGFSILPHRFFEYGLKNDAFVVYWALQSFVGRDQNECWPSHARLRRMAGNISKNTLLKALQALEEQGFIEIQTRIRPDGGHTSNLYIILAYPALDQHAKIQAQPPADPAESAPPPAQNLNGGGSKFEQGGVQNLNPNNTHIESYPATATPPVEVIPTIDPIAPKEKNAKNGAPTPKPPQPLTPYQAFVKAYAELLGLDLALNRSKITANAARLWKAGYTAENLATFRQWWFEVRHGLEGAPPPSIGVINAEIRRALEMMQRRAALPPVAPAWQKILDGFED
jgi:hypothetical protein